MRVPLLDLKPQYLALKKELDEAVIKVAESQHFILGPEVTEMEKEFCNYLGCKHALGVSSGTDALLLALMAIDIKPGDEVIVPTYSFFATAGVVSRLFATPVLVENDPVTFNMDPKDFEKKITAKTKAVIPVHLYGQSADLDEIVKIAKDHNIIVIEDAAQAIGTQYKDGRFVGTVGDIGCFSFFPSKNLGCYGDGGLVTTNNEDLAKVLNIKRVHGGEPKYYHKVIGGNFRIDALQAAVLRVKLPHLDKWSEKRRQNANRYTQLFVEAGLAEETGKTSFDAKNKVLLPKAAFERFRVRNFHIYNQYIVRVDKRDQLREFLSKNEIGTEIYYPVPFHLQECFKELGHKKGDFPLSEFSADTSIALPIFPELSDDQLVFVVETIKKFFNQ
ncbi:MAG: DegT/DnrJ/EryC1/StrS family aminotransferase [Ignavibacteriaceae bacterium]